RPGTEVEWRDAGDRWVRTDRFAGQQARGDGRIGLPFEQAMVPLARPEALQIEDPGTNDERVDAGGADRHRVADQRRAGESPGELDLGVPGDVLGLGAGGVRQAGGGEQGRNEPGADRGHGETPASVTGRRGTDSLSHVGVSGLPGGAGGWERRSGRSPTVGRGPERPAEFSEITRAFQTVPALAAAPARY